MSGLDDVLGLNARNELISRANPPAAIRLVDDKQATKDRLAAHGVPVPPTLAHVRSGRQLRNLPADELPDAWACKPNRSLGGQGILLAGARTAGGWVGLSGRAMAEAEVAHHVRRVLDGEYSPGGRDSAIFEPLLVPHADLARLASAGLPDVRVVCHDDLPLAAMLRLPTVASEGRANLHAGGIGASVDLETGEVVGAMQGRRPLTHHPDTGNELIGAVVPHWEQIVDSATRCGAATGLSWLGADVVVDHDRGPMLLEVNARPGLEIQNVGGLGLRPTANRHRRVRTTR